MRHKVLFRPSAERHLLDTARFYEQKAEGLGLKFFAAVDKITEFLVSSPKIYPIAWDGLRRAIVTGFPFTLYYQIDGKEVWVIAILHQRLNPEKVRDWIQD